MKKEDSFETLRQIGSKIAELRTQAGFTQAQLAERLGMRITNYQRIEHGQNITVHTLIRVAAAIGIGASKLLEAPRLDNGVRRRGRPPKH